jgi:hypothetical protein
MVATRKPGKGQNMEIYEKQILFLKCIKIQQVTENVSNSYDSGLNWVCPDRKDDARPHPNGPGARN